MDSSPTALAKLLLPKTPLLLKTALWHSLSLSPQSSKWDLKTSLTVTMIREMTGPNASPQPIGKTQRFTLRDPGVKGKMWVSKVAMATPSEDDARQLLFKAVREMGTGEEKWEEPEQKGVEAEWNGYRSQAKDGEGEPVGMGEKEKYEALMQETTSQTTVLYFHGGAMYLLDPSGYRGLGARIARQTGGRVFNVRYRLSPQHAFPAALLDAFTAYLSLLSPPPGAFHEAVPAGKIVFGGDSAGGLCCTALLQLLLQIHRSAPDGHTPTVRFHGKLVDIPLPAGLALTSPWLDITRSLPSIENETTFDYLPPPSQTDKKDFPADEVWPANPPRADLYCEASALLHPLVSPLAAQDWSGSPPLFFSIGQEMLRDEGAVLAQRAVSQGVSVTWREFEAMPHVFAVLLDGLPESEVHYKEHTEFIKTVVEPAKPRLQSSAVMIRAKTLKREDKDVAAGLTQITDEEAKDMMVKGKERIERKFARGRDPAAERPML
ncbi:hypothetical protein COCC4DRAFT_60752 [Bipolaris maydis ATCC 48331]|uniref:Alpha/beta hydrolase fold-3 domain-containing protein n=2 Tax=Cochliobolus heterostrophus TaxID=5016 RepID=M2UN65_COCH5|nr:uncharacterized protein COCC4DRAFT_60752 [Bipolaris maydis ATCC 48331]EMD89368.1 hypothetical protein COCHEDRAFT_1180901 [Bipolaris maydis C5]KAH7552700.1 hypothetical protein BM1_08651 [Bipolaris maydis]ENI04915.1 hypothetical protein COCC4DRAFT_60752 [Bipolaris maydis ATCC 48331]KAJ5057223.1 acetyl-hydrolase [Bipolaris maydis]KAJ6212716.1 acetyl-hydrolase [Bipolaris maydis]